MLSADQLKAIMPHCRHPEYLPFLNQSLVEFDISTPLRIAAYTAQLAHESEEFRYMEEIASGEAYEGRKDLGNVFAGDGRLYKGRGPIQLSGRANYKKYGDLLGIDLVSQPKRAASPEVGFRIAGLFWKLHGLNELADAEAFREITKRINGGYNGLAERRAYYERAKKVLRLAPSVSADSTGGPAPIQADEPPAAAGSVEETPKGPEADTTTLAPPKPENPKPQDVVMNLAVAEDKTGPKSWWTFIGTAITALFAWLTANIGEAFGWIKNLDINQFLKWLMILVAAVAIIYLLRQMVKMVISLVGNISYNLMSMWSHANAETNNVKIASPAPREDEK